MSNCPHCALVLSAVWAIATTGSEDRLRARQFFQTALDHCDRVSEQFAKMLRSEEDLAWRHRTASTVPLIAYKYLNLFKLSQDAFEGCDHSANSDAEFAYGVAAGVTLVRQPMTRAQSRWFVWIVDQILKTSGDVKLRKNIITRFNKITIERLNLDGLLDKVCRISAIRE